MARSFFFFFFLFFFFGWGKRREIRHARCEGLQCGLPVGLLARWTVCRLTYPLTPPPPLPVFPATSRYEKSTVGYGSASKSTKRLSPQRVLSSRWWVYFFLSSMKRVSIQLFLMRLDMRSFSICFVSFGETSWLFIAFLFLDFHMAHVIIEIRMRSLSESLL